MTLIIFVIFSFGHNLHIRLKLYKIGHCLTNLYAVSSLAVDAFSYFWKENLWKKIIQAELLFLLAFFFFSTTEQSTPSSRMCSSNPLSSLYLCIPLFAQQCSSANFSSWTHRLTFAHLNPSTISSAIPLMCLNITGNNLYHLKYWRYLRFWFCQQNLSVYRKIIRTSWHLFHSLIQKWWTQNCID